MPIPGVCRVANGTSVFKKGSIEDRVPDRLGEEVCFLFLANQWKLWWAVELVDAWINMIDLEETT